MSETSIIPCECGGLPNIEKIIEIYKNDFRVSTYKVSCSNCGFKYSKNLINEASIENILSTWNDPDYPESKYLDKQIVNYGEYLYYEKHLKKEYFKYRCEFSKIGQRRWKFILINVFISGEIIMENGLKIL